ncbi:hypothetical protein MMC10_005731 [Thelotrema lepadinum]|nr:hypothetical protein [Thelotrema lepadinum]
MASAGKYKLGKAWPKFRDHSPRHWTFQESWHQDDLEFVENLRKELEESDRSVKLPNPEILALDYAGGAYLVKSGKDFFFLSDHCVLRYLPLGLWRIVKPTTLPEIVHKLFVAWSFPTHSDLAEIHKMDGKALFVGMELEMVLNRRAQVFEKDE